MSKEVETWLNDESFNRPFPVPHDSYSEHAFYQAMHALCEINKMSRKGTPEDVTILSNKLTSIKHWRRSFCMSFEIQHNAIIEMCDAIDCSLALLRRPTKKENKTGHVYFLVDAVNSLVKIGWSVDVYGRVASIKGVHPNKLTLEKKVETEDRKLETNFHKRFHKYRINGEWFKLEGALKSFLGYK